MKCSMYVSWHAQVIGTVYLFYYINSIYNYEFNIHPVHHILLSQANNKISKHQQGDLKKNKKNPEGNNAILTEEYN